METISLNINGVCRELAVGKNWTLLKTLRDGLRLTGTKCGCETGDLSLIHIYPLPSMNITYMTN